jgi:hypothetical protein
VVAASSLAGCTAEQGESGPGKEGSPNSALDPRIEVIDAEVLVIGCGINGIEAAAQVITEGKHVTIIDKGPFTQNGVTGFSWDALNAGMGNPPVESMAAYLPNGDLAKAA